MRLDFFSRIKRSVRVRLSSHTHTEREWQIINGETNAVYFPHSALLLERREIFPIFPNRAVKLSRQIAARESATNFTGLCPLYQTSVTFYLPLVSNCY